MTAPASASQLPSRRARDAFQATIAVAMGLIALLLGALLWLLYRNEAEEARLALIKDALWAEQTLHFQLASIEQKLVQIASQEAGSEAGFGRRADHLRATTPELVRLLRLDADGRTVDAFPPGRGAATARESFVLARSLGRPVYDAPLVVDDGGYGYEVLVPIHRDGAFAGMLVARVSFEAVLTHHVPWWFAEKYQLSLLDAAGQSLASKSQLPVPDDAPFHRVAFDPPGRGLLIQVAAYGTGSVLVRQVPVLAGLGLASVAVWSLWSVRRHSVRREKAERALLDAYAFRKAMEDSLTVGLRARDLDGRITYVNPAFCRMTGFAAEELVGSVPPMPYWIPEEFERTLALHRQVLAGEAPEEGFELPFRRKDGTRFDALIYEAPLIDAEGRHTGWMASILDVTERRRGEELARQQQEQMQRTARLVTMGEMASTLAHELNQPLSAIAGYSAGCLNRLSAAEPRREELVPALEKLSAQAQRAGRVIRGISDFVRKREPVIGPCDMAEIVADCVSFASAEARKRGVTVEVDPAPGLPQVLADRILLEQVLLNLVRNAMEAMAQVPRDRRAVRIAGRAGQGVVEMRIEDRGCGIPAEVADRIFSPFFTTKEEGMGMGLNICRSVVEHHGGRLWFEPNPGGGTVFRFTLPAVPA